MLRILAFLAMLIPAAAVAQQASLSSEEFSEQYSERVRVSGKPLVGVVVSGRAEAPAGTALQGDTLSVASSTLGGTPLLCIRARTQDGRYVATNILRVGANAAPAGDARVTWQTKYAKELNTAQLHEIAMLAFAGECDSPVDVIPVLMGSGAVSGDLQVIINTLGEAVTAALRDPNTRRLIRRVKCARVPGSARVAFDAVCDFGTIASLQGALPRMMLWLDQANDDGTQMENLQTVIIRVAH